MMNDAIEIKVCGMRKADNISDLIKLKPDYIGFIFYPKSPRFIDQKPDVNIPDEVKKVGVFVNESERTINESRIRFGLDILQLHGNESPELCFLLRQNGTQVMKVFRVDEQFDFSQTRAYQDYCDYFLFDTSTSGYGGSGHKFNWESLKGYNNHRPVFLSGGIGPDDVEAIKSLTWLNLKAVDVNSCFETAPGEKDIELLRPFFKQLKAKQP